MEKYTEVEDCPLQLIHKHISFLLLFSIEEIYNIYAVLVKN